MDTEGKEKVAESLTNSSDQNEDIFMLSVCVFSHDTTEMVTFYSLC